MTKTNDFTIAGYNELLLQFIAMGYRSCSFGNFEAKSRSLLLRHDIDLWPEYALPLAKIESDLGLTATYFFLVRSPLYSILSSSTHQVFADLVAMGHSIGLHFDAVLFDHNIATLEMEVAWELEILKRLCGTLAPVISFHRPAKALVGWPGQLSGMDHTYQPKFFSEIGYVSDSRCCWAHGHPLANNALEQGSAIQLLTHPIWWATDSAGNASWAIQCFEETRKKATRKMIAETITGYSERLGKIVDGE